MNNSAIFRRRLFASATKPKCLVTEHWRVDANGRVKRCGIFAFAGHRTCSIHSSFSFAPTANITHISGGEISLCVVIKMTTVTISQHTRNVRANQAARQQKAQQKETTPSDSGSGSGSNGRSQQKCQSQELRMFVAATMDAATVADANGCHGRTKWKIFSSYTNENIISANSNKQKAHLYRLRSGVVSVMQSLSGAHVIVISGFRAKCIMVNWNECAAQCSQLAL